MPKIKVGLDIGFSSIKVVALSHQSNPAKLISLGTIASPQPGIISDSDTELEAVAGAIKKLLDAAKIQTKEVIAALPESKVFTRVIDDLPLLNDQELASAIRYASEEFIPMPIAEVNLNWQVISREKFNQNNQHPQTPLSPLDKPNATSGKGGRTVVFVVASPRNIVNKYLKVLSLASLKPAALETEIIASTRALVGNNPFSPTTLVVQLGATTTDFAVVSRGLILLTRSISTGGVSLTRAIAQQFNFELTQAEEYKKVYGLLSDQLEGKVFQTLRPIVDVIKDETKRVIQAFQTKNAQNQIKRVVLSGGGAKLPGLVIYLANNLGLEVQEADPWYFVAKDKALAPRLAADASLYSVAVGLALRED
jgi:type IV pilus assembly protein PilM